MRLALVALLLSPSLLHGQARLQARLAQPRAMVAASAAAPASAVSAVASHTAIRISTGITPPAITRSAEVVFSARDLQVAADNNVVVNLTIDEQGNAENIKVVKSASKALDESVLSAVRQYHFRPASLDDQPIAMQMNLHVIFER